MVDYRNWVNYQRSRRHPKRIAAQVYAYLDSESEPRPIELDILPVIDRFGIQAVYGRTLYVQEVKALMEADIISSAYRNRAASGNLAEWSAKYPEMAKRLDWAMKLTMSENG